MAACNVEGSHKATKRESIAGRVIVGVDVAVAAAVFDAAVALGVVDCVDAARDDTGGVRVEELVAAAAHAELGGNVLCATARVVVLLAKDNILLCVAVAAADLLVGVVHDIAAAPRVGVQGVVRAVANLRRAANVGGGVVDGRACWCLAARQV